MYPPSPTTGTWNLSNWLGLNSLAYPTTSAYGAPVVSPYGLPPASVPMTSSVPMGGFPPLPSAAYPSSIYPNAAPPTLFPGGYAPPSSYGSPGGTLAPPTYAAPSSVNPMFTNPNSSLWGSTLPSPSRFFVTPRFRHTWIAGDDTPESLGINDSDVSLVFQIPRFLGSTQPLYIAPSFSLHLWDGPSDGVADLPSSAYSGFLDFGWETDPNRTFGTELGVRVGVFTDFDTFEDDSLRILGKALGRIRLTPKATARFGAFWIARNRYKLIPAAGILWLPNPDSRMDLFFPEPKLSHYVSTFGNTDMWWYVSGYYGGGTWTIQREDDSSDRVDINDLRVVIGIEWGRNELLRQGQRVGFLEGGYVFQRELVYNISPLDNIDLDDSFMLRAGLVY